MVFSSEKVHLDDLTKQSSAFNAEIQWKSRRMWHAEGLQNQETTRKNQKRTLKPTTFSNSTVIKVFQTYKKIRRNMESKLSDGLNSFKKV